jgi:hypothetical protein
MAPDAFEFTLLDQATLALDEYDIKFIADLSSSGPLLYFLLSGDLGGEIGVSVVVIESALVASGATIAPADFLAEYRLHELELPAPFESPQALGIHDCKLFIGESNSDRLYRFDPLQ